MIPRVYQSTVIMRLYVSPSSAADSIPSGDPDSNSPSYMNTIWEALAAIGMVALVEGAFFLYRLFDRSLTNSRIRLFENQFPFQYYGREWGYPGALSFRPTVNPYREEILSSSEYGDLMKDPDMLFHGINMAISKIPSILKLGILSKQAASCRGISLGFNCGSERDPGVAEKSFFVNCTRSPVHEESVGDRCGSFGCYIQDGISFVIKGISAATIRSHRDYIPGNAMVKGSIPGSSIIGLVVPRNLLQTKLKDLNFLKGGASGTFHLRCQTLLNFLKGKIPITQEEASSISFLIESKAVIDDLEPLMNGLLLRYLLGKVNAEEPCLASLLKVLIPSELKIYDTNGIEITLD